VASSGLDHWPSRVDISYFLACIEDLFFIETENKRFSICNNSYKYFKYEWIKSGSSHDWLIGSQLLEKGNLYAIHGNCFSTSHEQISPPLFNEKQRKEHHASG